MNIVISGASGLVGTALQERLRAEGHSVTNLVRRAPSNANESQWDPVAGTIDTDVIAQAYAVINLSGAGIGDRRWS
ncbi:MAG: NAD-dependent epimerase/dehydratase family protein, partial [Actinomycetota bacterium]